MSESWIKIVPIQTGFVPQFDAAQSAKILFEAFADGADEVQVEAHSGIQIFDCGSNLDAISCPRCGSTIDFDWWGDTMSRDFDKSITPAGFRMDAYALPCCWVRTSLDGLVYDFHQAFGRFALSARNPRIGELTSKQVAELAQALGCEVSVVYKYF